MRDDWSIDETALVERALVKLGPTRRAARWYRQHAPKERTIESVIGKLRRMAEAEDKRAGLQVNPYLAARHVLWLRENTPEGMSMSEFLVAGVLEDAMAEGV